MVISTVCSNIYCYCLQRLAASLKFVNTKQDNYLLTLNCTEMHVILAMNHLENFLAEEFKCFIMLDVIHMNF